MHYWIVEDCEKALAFYVKAFGAMEQSRECLPDAHVVAVELALGPHRIMLCEADFGAEVPASRASESEAALILGCQDQDELMARVIAAGGSGEVLHGRSVWVGGADVVVHDPAGRRWVLHPG